MSGPAQNPDGTLKDARDMEWSFSRSPSPNLPHIKKMATPKKGSPKNHAQKQTIAKIKVPTHPTRSITSSNTQKQLQRVNLTLHDKISILDFMDAEADAGRKTSQTKVVQHFRSKFPSLTQSSVSRIKTEAQGLRRRAEDTAQLFYKRPHIVRFPQVEESLALWIVQQEARSVKITGDVIKEKARRFAELYNIPAEKFLLLSNGWLDSFKARHMLKEYRFHGEAGSVTDRSVAAARVRLQKITAQYDKKDLYNMDETGLFYRMPPDRSLATKQMSGVKGDKTRITVAFTVNADGSDCRTPLFIGHARRPRCFNRKEGTELGFDYHWNKKAWMTGIIFQKYLEAFDADMRGQNRKVALIIDNAPSHIFNLSSITNTEVIFLEPLMTSHIQPMDAGIIKAFKAHYRRLYIRQAIDRDEAGFEDIYHINQLEGQRLCLEAWAQITCETVANCWSHSGILSNDIPIDPSLDLDDAVAQLEMAVKELSVQVIAARNVIPAAELVSLEVEQLTEEKWTDEDIVEQVKFDQIEADGGEVEELQEPMTEVNPPMQLREACQAITRLDHLFQHRYGECFLSARKLFPLLRMNLRAEQMASLQQPEIRQYFQ